MQQNNWDLSLTLTIQADDEESILNLLKDIRRRIKRGESRVAETHCIGEYQFQINGNVDTQKETPVDVIRGVLSLAGVYLPQSVIDAWTWEQQEEAESWAASVHLEASDNDVQAPPKPAFVAEAEAQHGMTLAEFQESW